MDQNNNMCCPRCGSKNVGEGANYSIVCLSCNWTGKIGNMVSVKRGAEISKKYKPSKCKTAV